MSVPCEICRPRRLAFGHQLATLRVGQLTSARALPRRRRAKGYRVLRSNSHRNSQAFLAPYHRRYWVLNPDTG